MYDLRVGVVADRKGAEFCEALRRRGAAVLWGPTLTTLPPASDAALAEETQAVLASEPAWFVATTGTGVKGWLDAVARHGVQDRVVAMLRRTPTVARGAKAAAAVQSFGVFPAFVSPQETMRDVLRWLAPRVEPGEQVAVQVCGGESAGSLDALRARGATVHTVTPYRWALPDDVTGARSVIAAVIAGDVDVIACTSPPAARHLLAIADADGHGGDLRAALRERVPVAAVGPVTAAAFEDSGVPVHVMPERSRTGPLIREIEGWYVRRHELGHPTTPSVIELVPRARAARVGSGVVVFGPQEFGVLAALVRRRGTVCRIDHLATAVWGHEVPKDPNVVKHHVARVRRKLGDLGASVETVRGVGYRFVDPRAS